MNRIKQLRIKAEMKQIELAQKLGVSQGNLSNWENGNYEPDYSTLSKLCEIFNCTTDYILGRPVNKEIVPYQFDRDVIQINVYGKIPAGIPVELCEDIIGTEEIPAKWTRGGKTFFGLQVTGNSMLPDFKDGDILIFRNTPDCENGQLCAVTVNGNEATFKKVVKQPNGVTLQPLNHEFEPMFFSNEQIENLPVAVIGVVKQLIRSY